MSNNTIRFKGTTSFHVKIQTITRVCPLRTTLTSANKYKQDICYYFGFPYMSARFIRYVLGQTGEYIIHKNKHISQQDKKLVQDIIDDLYSIHISAKPIIYLNDATLSDYSSYAYGMLASDEKLFGSKKRIFDMFCETVQLDLDGKTVDVIAFKPGLEFITSIIVVDEYKETLSLILKHIDNIGDFRNKYFGRVAIDFSWDGNDNNWLSRKTLDWFQLGLIKHPIGQYNLENNKKYTKLKYSIYSMSASCPSWSWEEKKYDNLSYIAGKSMFYWLTNNVFDDVDNNILSRELKCSNAYLNINRRRSIPAPCSFMVEKLNRSKLKDRSIRGCLRDENKFVQLVHLDDTYVLDFTEKNVYYSKPVKDRRYFDFRSISELGKSINKSELINVLTENQLFSGFIEGPDEYIRRIYEQMYENNILLLGEYTNLGLGSFIELITGVEYSQPQDINLVDEFVIFCISDIKLFNEHCMYSYDASYFLRLLKEKYNIDKDLEIVTEFKEIKSVPNYKKAWGETADSHKCISAGSSFYIKVKQGKIDLNKIKHCWIGLDNHYGFGELICVPANDIYDKTFTEVKFWPDGKLDLSSKQIFISNQFQNSVSLNTVFENLKNLAILYKMQNDGKEFSEEDLPKDVIQSLKNTFNINIDDEVLYSYYEKVYEEFENV